MMIITHLVMYHNYCVITAHSGSVGHNPWQEVELLRLRCSDYRRNTIGENSTPDHHLWKIDGCF